MRCLSTPLLIAISAGQMACASAQSAPAAPQPASPEVVAREESAKRAYRAASYLAFDRDGDGGLNREEWRAREWAYYLIRDRDGDGRLNFTEFIALECGEPRPPQKSQFYTQCVRVRGQEFRRQTGAEDGEIGADDVQGLSDRRFRKNDRNNDGLVTEAEVRQR